MKTRKLSGWVLGMVLASGALAPGVAQNAIDPSPKVAAPEKPVAAVLSPAVTTPAALAPPAGTASTSLPVTPAASGTPVAKAPPAILSM